MRDNIKDVLMERDGITASEANELINETRAEIICAIECGDYSMAEEVLMYDLGLEIDYLIDLL